VEGKKIPKKQLAKFWKKGYIETRLKHAVLETYLSAYWKILGKKVDGFLYIDGFAGRGRFDDGSEGSPLLAMRSVADLRRKGSLSVPVRFAFIEADEGNHRILRSAALKLAEELKLKEPLIKKGTFQEHIFDVLDELEGGCFRCPTFVFVDPFGYTDVPLDLIFELAQPRNRELFITFMSHHMGRFLSDQTKSKTFDRVFGGKSWQQCFFKERRSHQECLVSLYASTLNRRFSKSIQTFIFPFRVESIEGGGLYHLIHISHHPKARQVMDNAVSAAGATKRDAFKKEVKEKGLGFSVNDAVPSSRVEDAIIKILVSAGAPVPIFDVVSHLWRQDQFLAFRWRDFEAAVISLEQSGLIRVERPPGQPKRTRAKRLYPEKGETLRFVDPLAE